MLNAVYLVDSLGFTSCTLWLSRVFTRSRLNIGASPPDVSGQKIKGYLPHRRNVLPGGETIGITQANQVLQGKTLTFDASQSARTDGGDKPNKILRKHDLNVEGSRFNADHVLERQLGGPDTVENLWPLNRAINGSGGSILSRVTFTLHNGAQAKISDLKNTDRKYFLKVVSTL
ncbi:hypothetical protein E7T06_05530 [Deinococcus sp. Arct2-2]|uniref:hypothetical protein n=1 Tax=Deinococcus sp. Arct2-2 TaxID=2568653 RepID=UPI0010A39119|nr:hypothetical protein [Deinococcus sp. Arct2-2]THF70813.1 hypothetical protein E7T06_05530 [Deinococcus sp. Arct2-2]